MFVYTTDISNNIRDAFRVKIILIFKVFLFICYSSSSTLVDECWFTNSKVQRSMSESVQNTAFNKLCISVSFCLFLFYKLQNSFASHCNLHMNVIMNVIQNIQNLTRISSI